MPKNLLKVVALIGILALAGMACDYVTKLAGGGGGGGSEPPLLSDDFSDNNSGWGTGTDSQSSIEYVSGGLKMKMFQSNFFTWSTPNKKTYQGVHLEVTAKNDGGDQATAMGLLCNHQASDSSFYYFAMTPKGEYVIAKSTTGQEDVFLTNNDKWATSDKIAKAAPSYRIAADCGAGSLTLYVDGKKIDSVSDSSYSDGGVGLFLWSGDDASGEVTYDDFVIKALK